jgi:hypothetical protein
MTVDLPTRDPADHPGHRAASNVRLRPGEQEVPGARRPSTPPVRVKGPYPVVNNSCGACGRTKIATEMGLRGRGD